MFSKSRSAKGFTLIEMSIVLVIIGLIVGGILKGQELIDNSRQKNLAALIDRAKAGTTTFTDQFRAVPGDYARAENNIDDSTTNGDGNGNIDDGSGASAADVSEFTAVDFASDSEYLQYWNHLVLADLFPGTAVDGTDVGTVCGVDTPAPQGPYPQSCIGTAHLTHEGDSANFPPLVGHWFGVYEGYGDIDTEGGDGDGVMSPRDAFIYDTKFDDGVAFSGFVRGIDSGTGCGTQGGAAVDWTATSTALNCAIGIFGDF